MRAGKCTAPQPSEAKARVIQAVRINSVMMMQGVHRLGVRRSAARHRMMLKH
jgi:hypothetical protein